MATQLYKTDFYEWTQQQAHTLRRLAAERVNSELDLENLAEEIEGVAGSNRREVKSRLTTIIEHLLKIAYSPAYEPQNGWRGTVSRTRDDVFDIFEESPSLRNYAKEVFDECYDRGATAARSSHFDLALAPIPKRSPFDLEGQVLRKEWFPEPLVRPDA